MIKIAQISDLHFSTFSFKIKDLFSKRLIGMVNLLINRKKSYIDKHLYKLPSLFRSLDLDYVFISGDLTSTSLKKEFEKAKKFTSSFDKDLKFFIIPGNHDQYTKKAFQKYFFYIFFENKNKLEIKSLKKDKIEILSLSDKWVSIGLDTTLATSLFSASGLFSEDLEKTLIETLDTIPKDKNIILINHFPIIHIAPKRKQLKRRDVLLDIIKKHPNIKLYLHGHTHKLAVEKEDNLPFMICSGCSSHKKNGSFNLFEIENDKCKVINYKIKNNSWQENKTWQLHF